MNMVSIGVLAIVTAVLAIVLKPKSGEIAVLMTAACAVMILLSVLTEAKTVVDTVQRIVSTAQISTGYIAILLKVIGICLLTEFTANTCRDAGSTALAANVTLAGKILVTVTSLPLYADILNTVLGILQR